MRRLMLVGVVMLTCQAVFAQGKWANAIESFNKGYAQGQQQRALSQQEEMLDGQIKAQRLEMRERSGLRSLRALEQADKRANDRLVEVLALLIDVK